MTLTPLARRSTATRCSSSTPRASARCARSSSTPRSTCATTRCSCASAAASTAGFEALLYSDAELYFDSLRFNKPGTIPLETQTEVVDGCPLDCGLCPDHKQHACLGIIEVNTACNLDCPICFADSGHQPDGFSLTREQVATGLDAFVGPRATPRWCMFSGGEPTIHPQILEFVRLANDKGIGLVTLNTNGIRLAHDRRFVADLAAARSPGSTSSSTASRSGPTWRSAAGTCGPPSSGRWTAAPRPGWSVTLVAAVERGVNEARDRRHRPLRHGPPRREGRRLPARHPLPGRHLELRPRSTG